MRAARWDLVILFSLFVSCTAPHAALGASSCLKGQSFSGSSCDPESPGSASGIRDLSGSISELDQALSPAEWVRLQAILARQDKSACRIRVDVSDYPCSMSPRDEALFSKYVQPGAKGQRPLTQEDVNDRALDVMHFNASDLAAFTKMFGKSPLVKWYTRNDYGGYQTFIRQCEHAQLPYAANRRDVADTFAYPIDTATCHQIKAFAQARHELRDKSRAIALGPVKTPAQKEQAALVPVRILASLRHASPEVQYEAVMNQLGLDSATRAELAKPPTAAEIAKYKKQGIDLTRIHEWIKDFHLRFVSQLEKSGGSKLPVWKGWNDQGNPVYRVEIPMTPKGPLNEIMSALAGERRDADHEALWAVAPIAFRTIATGSPALDTALHLLAKGRIPKALAGVVTPSEPVNELLHAMAGKDVTSLAKFLDLCVRPIGTGLDDAKLRLEYLLAAEMQFSSERSTRMKSNQWLSRLDTEEAHVASLGKIEQSSRCYKLARSSSDMGAKMAPGVILSLLGRPVIGGELSSLLFAADSAGGSVQNARAYGASGHAAAVEGLESFFVNEALFSAVPGATGKIAADAQSGMIDAAEQDAIKSLGRATRDAIAAQTRKQFAQALESCAQMSFFQVVGQQIALHPSESPSQILKSAGQACATGGALHLAGAAVLGPVKLLGRKDISEGETLVTDSGKLQITEVNPDRNLLAAKDAEGKTHVYRLSDIKRSIVSSRVPASEADAVAHLNANRSFIDGKMTDFMLKVAKSDPAFKMGDFKIEIEHVVRDKLAPIEVKNLAQEIRDGRFTEANIEKIEKACPAATGGTAENDRQLAPGTFVARGEATDAFCR